jgi:hypothetical protein
MADLFWQPFFSRDGDQLHQRYTAGLCWSDVGAGGGLSL